MVPTVLIPVSVPGKFRRFRFPVPVRFLGHPDYEEASLSVSMLMGNMVPAQNVKNWVVSRQSVIHHGLSRACSLTAPLSFGECCPNNS